MVSALIPSWKLMRNRLLMNTIPLTLADQNKKVAIENYRKTWKPLDPLIKISTNNRSEPICQTPKTEFLERRFNDHKSVARRQKVCRQAHITRLLAAGSAWRNDFVAPVASLQHANHDAPDFRIHNLRAAAGHKQTISGAKLTTVDNFTCLKFIWTPRRLGTLAIVGTLSAKPNTTICSTSSPSTREMSRCIHMLANI